jgi:Cu+-exporting ATPase
MFTLIALGTGAAFLYSVVATVRRISSAAMKDEHGLVPSISKPRRHRGTRAARQVLELRAREKTGGAIRALLDLAPRRRSRSMRAARPRRSRSSR